MNKARRKQIADLTEQLRKMQSETALEEAVSALEDAAGM